MGNVFEAGTKMEEIRTTSDMIVHELRKKIISGALKPGTQLKNTQLAEEFGTSITPVREALSRLEKLDLAEYRPRCGWTVKGLDEDGMREVYAMRKILEVFAAEIICQSEPAKDLRELEFCCEEYRRNLESGNIEECIRVDIQFHCALVGLSGNRYAIEVMDRLRNLMRICRTFENYESNNRKSYEEHLRMVECLKARDLPGVKKCMDAHVRPCLFD